MKEFEKQKQEIIETIRIASDYAYDIKEGMEQTDIDYELSHMSVRLGRAIREINELQPPAMPTCSTCKYFQVQMSGFDKCLKQNAHVQNMIIWCGEKFGCIHHSALENKDENN